MKILQQGLKIFDKLPFSPIGVAGFEYSLIARSAPPPLEYIGGPVEFHE